MPAYTILETMIGISVFLLILLGVYLIYDTSQATFSRAEARASIQHEARSAMEEMRRELRMAGYDPSATGQTAVQNPTSASLEFITDVNDDNISDLVRYDRDATAKTIRRSVRSWTGTGWGSATVTTLATNVDGLAFQYFPSAAMPGLQRIGIAIQASETVPRQATQQQQVVTDVFLRNL
jgi:Tfp pilus assembly protein PilW